MLAGTLPHLSQQNVFLGAPLVLIPEEVVLLLEKRRLSSPFDRIFRLTSNHLELVVLVDDPQAHTRPSLTQLTEWNATRQAGVRSQLVAAEAKETSEVNAKRATSEDAVRKRREREEKRAKAAREKAIAEGLDPDEVVPTTIPETRLAPESDRPSTPSASTVNAVYTVTIPADSASELDWYDSSTCMYTTLEDARAAGVWTYPSTPYERAKCEVFRDLWEKGHYMGGGIKFGGDFLVYPGTPSVSRAVFARLTSLQVIRCGIIPISSQRCLSRLWRRSSQWKSSRTVVLGQPPKKRIYCADGTRRMRYRITL